MNPNLKRAALGVGALSLASPFGWGALFLVALAAMLINPLSYGLVGMAAYPAIAGSTKAQILTAATRDEEIRWEKKVIVLAAANSPFADNMIGGLGSGKPIISKSGLGTLAGTAINITTVDPLGGPVVQGNAVRVGNEEQISPGDFQLLVNIGWFGAGIDNTGKAQTIVGEDWDNISQEALAIRLAKAQSDDAMQDLKVEASSDNTVYPNGKTLDTLGTADVFNTGLVEASSGRLHDIGAPPCDARPLTLKDQIAGRINRYYQFTSNQNSRPIKSDSLYIQAAQLAMERGKTNNLFTGEYLDYDNNAIIPWQVIAHGGIGSIGSAVQPDALLGNALLATDTSGAGFATAEIDGGGSAAKAAATPLRNFFEFFPLFAYLPINGVTRTWTPRATYGYVAIVNSTDGKIALFRYTTNGGNTLTGLRRLAAASANGNLTTIGDMTWNSGSWTTAADGAGYQGVTSGDLAIGSKIYEVNSKGAPLGYGYGLGEMALVCGYGRVPLAGGGFKTMINRTEYNAPHNQAFGKGIEVCYGTAAFKRPDGKTPNYTLNVFARRIAGFPVIA